MSIIFKNIFLCALLPKLIVNASQSIDENNNGFDDDIMHYLFNNKSYNNMARPSNQVNVSLSFSYRQLVSLDERSGIMTSNIYLSVMWHDHRLEWSPANFNNITQIVIPARSLWSPDFSVINSAHNNFFVVISESNLALIESSGFIYLKVSVNSLQTRCQTNVYSYPFDTQNCSIQIGSWQLDSTRINFTSNKIHTEDLVYSSTWDILGVYINDQIYSSSRFPYLGLISNDVYFHVVIKRKPLYFMITFVPCFILNVATLLAFFVTNAIVVQVNLCI